MSDKIPISLHNSDLFLNPEFTDRDQKKINTDTVRNSIFKKGPSLGENNHLVSLHTSYLLPPLHSSTYISKAVASYLLTKQKFVNRNKSAEDEQSQDDNQNSWNDKKSEALLLATGSTFGKGVFALRYELRSGLTPSSKTQVELQKKDSHRPKSHLVKKNEHLALDQTRTKSDLVQFDYQIDKSTTKSFSGLSLILFDKLNKGIRSSISREFLLVTTNLILFSVLAIVQKSNYGKSSLLTSGRSSHTILCASKMSNTTPSYLSTAGVRQYLHEMKTGYLTPVRQHIVGVFLGKSNISLCKTGRTKTNNKAEKVKEEKLAFFFYPTDKDTTPSGLKKLPANTPQNSIHFRQHLIQPWYCIKACNTLNNKIVATRSLWQVDKNVNVYNDSQIQGFQYYLPFYKSKERIFTETDTIPAKRDTVFSQKAKDFTTSHAMQNQCKTSFCTSLNKSYDYAKTKFLYKLESNSCIAVSEAILKRCFYKYGFLLVFPSKEPSEFYGSKKTNQSDFIRSQSSNDIRQDFGYRENGTYIADDMSSYKSRSAPATYINKNELDYRAVPYQGVIKVKNGYVQLAKRYSAWFLQKQSFCINRLNSALHENIGTTPAGQSLGEVPPVKNGFHIRFTTLKTTERNNSFLISYKRSDKQKGHYNQFLSSIFKALLPVISEPEFNRYSSALNKIENLIQSHKKEKQTSNQAFFPSGFSWSQHNLGKLNFADFFPVQNNVPIFSFMPDRFLRNTSVSGYHFPELQEKEISYLFRKRAIFHFYLNCKKSSDKTFVENLFTQVTTLFRTLNGVDLITQVVSTPFLINENGVMMCQVRTSHLPEQERDLPYLESQALAKANAKTKFEQKRSLDKFGYLTQESTDQSSIQDSDLKNVKNPVPSFETDGIKMQYTQVDLAERENIFDVFQKLGRDYEDYLRQPKDSLPALIISPSLEDDREIEEEGIRIFRKRDFVKNKKNSPEGKNGESYIDSALSLLSTTPELSENKNISGRAASKNETQNHQLLVKNALRQAQEEIDSIAKKEEKGTEKDKQVIPPLTRLEALYTIRNRERKREQAKDFMLDKGIISSLRSSKAKLSSRSGTKLGSAVFESKRAATHTSLPIFDKLFLYSDKTNDHSLNEYIDTYPHTKQSFVSTTPTWGVTPWLFSKFGDDTICTDRKHSFFGEMSLPSKRLTAQEQKQIFQQKANPLLKVQTKKTEFEFASPLSSSKGLKIDYHNLDLSSVSSTLPLSLLSQFSVLRKANYNKNKVPQFKVGAVKAHRLPSSTGVSESVTHLSKNQRPPALNVRPVASSDIPFENTHTEYVRSLPEPFISKNRIYFYNNLSQNKPCQGSAPKIKSTPLQSPVAHRIWQPKRMEPSTFRVSQRIKDTPVLPKITQKDWKNIMEWQLKKYFVEEDKRLLPLSLNNSKKLKIKKINLYLPWISIKKATDSLNTSSRFTSSQSFSAWPLTRLDLTKDLKQSINYRDLAIKENNGKGFTHSVPTFHFPHQCSDTFYKTTKYWQLPIQQSVYTATNAKTELFKNISLYKNKVYAKADTKATLMQKLRFCTYAKQSFANKQTNKSLIPIDRSAQQSSTLQTVLTKGPVTSSDNRVSLPKRNRGVCKKVFNESILFESVTKYSWLFIYTFVFVLMFKQLFTFVYKVGLKNFFINFLNSDFGRTITSEDFRYSVQNSPLTEFYRPTKRLGELFGLEKNKVQLLEIVWFLRNNCQGRNGPRGILLVGPPGVENVSVVQAIAGEANLPIIVQSLEKIAQDNEPQRQLEQLYMRAHKQAPCVLFLDQLDTIGARRDQLFTDSLRGNNGNPLISSSSGQDKQVMSSLSSQNSLNSHISGSILNVSPEAYLFGSDYDNNNTISSNPFQTNQTSFGIEDPNATLNKDVTNTVSPGNKLNVVLRLLTILDGITQSSGVVTVATARDLSKLDPALLRPKRFDRRIYLSLPNQQDRVHLFKIQTQNIGHIKEMPWNYLSLQTESMSAADIKSAINYSLFKAVLKNSVHTVETLEYGISCVKTLTDKRTEKNKNDRESVSSFQGTDTTISENTNGTK